MKTGKQKCKEMILFLKEQGIEKQATKKEIELAIMEIAGTSDRTLRQYFNALQVLGFIYTENNIVFFINQDKLSD